MAAIVALLAPPLLLAILAILLLLLVFNFGARLLPTSPRGLARLDLRGKTVLVTGASAGIGREMARIIHAKGANLILAARSTDKLEKFCAELAEQQGKEALGTAQYCRLDLEEIARDKAALAQFLATLWPLLPSSNGAADHRRVDVLVNNAGQMAYGAGARTELSVLRRLVDVNYLGHVALWQALTEEGAIPDDGAVLLMGSIAGRVALPYMGAYCAAKHAVQAFFDSVRAEERPRLQILTVSAGYVNTDLGPSGLNERGRPTGRRDPGQVGGMSAEWAAAEIVAALEARETELLLAPFLPRFLVGFWGEGTNQKDTTFLNAMPWHLAFLDANQ